MDGELFDVDTPMGTHPQCRCSLEPEPIGWDELARMHGFEMPPGDYTIPKEPTGPEAFAALPADQQRRILDTGRKDGLTPRWDAYHAGQVQLRDFVHTTHSDEWGTTRRESGLSAALERSKKRNGGKLPGRPLTPTSSPEVIASYKSSLPVRHWEVAGQRKIMPQDLQNIVEARTDILRMGDHAWSNIQPPPHGAPLKKNGVDAVRGKGQHHSAQPYVDALDRWLARWELQGTSPAGKTPKGQRRWEVFSRVSPDLWLLTVIAERIDEGEHYIHSAYLFNDASVQARLKAGFLQQRKK